jgi:hypothetical protein
MIMMMMMTLWKSDSHLHAVCIFKANSERELKNKSINYRFLFSQTPPRLVSLFLTTKERNISPLPDVVIIKINNKLNERAKDGTFCFVLTYDSCPFLSFRSLLLSSTF